MCWLTFQRLDNCHPKLPAAINHCSSLFLRDISMLLKINIQPNVSHRAAAVSSSAKITKLLLSKGN